jgi:hypothetical protein
MLMAYPRNTCDLPYEAGGNNLIREERRMVSVTCVLHVIGAP